MGSGDFIWYEIVTHDPETVESFYKKTVGWTPKVESNTGGDPYTLFLAGDTPAAGISPASPPEDAQPHWFGYIQTDDVDETAEQIESLDGELHAGPMEVAGFGRFYIVGDPSGVVFAIFTPDNPSDFDPVVAEGPGHFGWKELYAENLDASFDFYSELFGWERGPLHEMEEGRYQVVELDGDEIGGLTGLDEMERENLPVPHWNFYIRVQDTDASAAAVEANDGEMLNGPMEVPGGDRIAIFRDPTGAVASFTS